MFQQVGYGKALLREELPKNEILQQRFKPENAVSTRLWLFPIRHVIFCTFILCLAYFINLLRLDRFKYKFYYILLNSLYHVVI